MGVRAVALSFVAALVGSGCASTQRVTWDDVTPASSAPPPADPPRKPEPAHEPVWSVGARIDGALQRFVGERARFRHHPRTSLVWGEAWTRVLDEIARACESPPRASDLGAFVRARVTLEVELDSDRRRGVLLPDDIEQRVVRVLLAVDESVAELRAANAPGTLAASPRIGEGDLVLRAPVVPLVVSSPFGVRADPFSGERRFHAGADLDAPFGSTVYAAASGLVVYSGSQGGYGKHVVLDHGDGVRTHYSHMSEIMVVVGETVEEGDAVGKVGSTGRSTGPHLHFAVTNAEGEFLDPIAILDVPFKVIEKQVKVGPKDRRQTYTLKNSGDSVEIVAK